MPQSLPEGDDQSSRASLQQLTKLMCAHAMQTHHEVLSDKPWHPMTRLQKPHSLHCAGNHTPRMAKGVIFRTAVIPLSISERMQHAWWSIAQQPVPCLCPGRQYCDAADRGVLISAQERAAHQGGLLHIFTPCAMLGRLRNYPLNCHIQRKAFCPALIRPASLCLHICMY